MSDSPNPGWIIGGATTIVGVLWAALRASDARNVARLEQELKAMAEKLELRERSEDRWQRMAFEYAAELRAAAAKKRERDSLPPMRDELPTLNAILELRSGDAPPHYREPPLNPARRIVETYSTTARPTHPAPPGTPDDPVALAPPLSGVLAPPPRRPRGSRER